MNVSKIAPIAKAVVTAGGSVIVIAGSVVTIASLFADGLLTQEEAVALWSNITVILAALGLPVAVYRTPNKEA